MGQRVTLLYWHLVGHIVAASPMVFMLLSTLSWSARGGAGSHLSMLRDSAQTVLGALPSLPRTQVGSLFVSPPWVFGLLVTLALLQPALYWHGFFFTLSLWLAALHMN